ncbi:PorT family protein [Weeksella virosa]|uniref:PorT family protein n=1 Tax=Weeksella virosa TaxID=1014 RepID=UPI0025557D20|nr:PorT family protein [Weeksella virosa]MDK7375262.1 PorT family protein [Weeksella virosa]
MIKKFIVLSMLCLFGMQINAQRISIDLNNEKVYDEKVSPKVKEEIEVFSTQIKDIVNKEKVKMDEEIAKVNLQLSEKKITETQADEEKKAIAERYAEQINTKITSLGFDLDDVIKKQVNYAIMGKTEPLSEKTISNLKKKYRSVNELNGYMSWGIMSFANNDNEKLNQHLSFSSNLEAGLVYHRQFNRTSPFELLTGLVMSWRTIRFDDNRYLTREADGNVDLIASTESLSKSKLRATYLMVPIGVKYHMTSKLKAIGDDFQYRNINKGLAVGFNLYGGAKISNNNIVKSDLIKQRDKDTNYNLNPFVYGAQVTLALNSVNIFARQDFSSYFKDNTFDDRRMLQFGLNFGF